MNSPAIPPLLCTTPPPIDFEDDRNVDAESVDNVNHPNHHHESLVSLELRDEVAPMSSESPIDGQHHHNHPNHHHLGNLVVNSSPAKRDIRRQGIISVII